MKVHFFSILFLLISLNVYSQTSNSTIFRFLELSPNAKVAALGNYHTSMIDGDFSVYHLNPAYLTGSETGDVSATFVNYLVDTKMGVVNTALKLDEFQTFGFGIRFMGYGDFNLLDEDGNNLGDMGVVDLALSGAYAYQLTEKWSGGAELNYIYSGYGAYKSSGLAGSAGLLYKDIANHFSMGLAIKNLGQQLTTYNGVNEPLPFDISLSITKKPAHFPAEINVTARQLNKWNMRQFGETEDPQFIDNLARHLVAGGRFFVSENVTFSLGYNHYLHEQNKVKENFDFAGMNLGVGFKIKSISVDMARTSYSKTGGAFVLSLKTKI